MPFANLDIDHATAKPDEHPIWGLNGTMITVGDIRRAKRALGLPCPEFDKDKAKAEKGMGLVRAKVMHDEFYTSPQPWL